MRVETTTTLKFNFEGNEVEQLTEAYKLIDKYRDILRMKKLTDAADKLSEASSILFQIARDKQFSEQDINDRMLPGGKSMAVDKEKQSKRQNDWVRNNKDRIELLVPKGMKAEWKAQADAEELTLAQWIIKKVQE